MKIEQIVDLYRDYSSHEVSKNIHPNERMLSPTNDLYFNVGRDAIRSIIAGLCLSNQTTDIRKVLDYGCGHGRVARHLRALFPSAELRFADIRSDGVDFCANEFSGAKVVLSENFSEQIIPADNDLIWVGSIFTHIDFQRANTLFCILFDSLALGGLLLITTHGRSKIKTTHGRKSIGEQFAEKLTDDFIKVGYGYTSYGRPELGDWGISAMDMKITGDFLALREDAVLITYSECGWAGQDVLIFCRKK